MEENKKLGDNTPRCFICDAPLLDWDAVEEHIDEKHPEVAEHYSEERAREQAEERYHEQARSHDQARASRAEEGW